MKENTDTGLIAKSRTVPNSLLVEQINSSSLLINDAIISIFSRPTAERIASNVHFLLATIVFGPHSRPFLDISHLFRIAKYPFLFPSKQTDRSRTPCIGAGDFHTQLHLQVWNRAPIIIVHNPLDCLCTGNQRKKYLGIKWVDH